MTKRIIVAGDSFTFGHGCSDRVYFYDEKTQSFVGDPTYFFHPKPSDMCWATLLQNKYPDVEIINLARPGYCNQAIFRDILRHFKDNPARPDDILMFNGTFSDRIEVATHHDIEIPTSWVVGWDHQSQKDAGVQYNIAKKMYIKHLYNDSIGINLSMTALLAAYGLAKASNMKFLWSLPMMNSNSGHHHGFTREFIADTIPKEITDCMIDAIMSYDFSHKLDYEFNITCRAPDYHINEKGHSIYYEKEIIPAIQNLL